jgi:cytochrome c-type biogenesis protein CcmH/NrfG
MMLGQALRKDGDATGAIRAFERAASLVPTVTGAESPHALIATIALEKKDTPRAIQALEALAKVDHTDVESARKLASLVSPLGDVARSAAAYERVVAIDPFDTDAQSNLGRLALQRKDADAAVRAFKVVLATGPADKASAHLDLAESYVLKGQKAEAKRQILYALEIAPSFERAQELLLKLVDGQVQ